MKKLCAYFARKKLLFLRWGKKQPILLRKRMRLAKANRRQRKSQITESSVLMGLITPMLLFFLLFVLVMAFYHILYRAKQSSGNAELYQWLSRLRNPYLDPLIWCFWRIYDFGNAVFGTKKMDASNRCSMVEAVRLVITPLGIASIVLSYINSVKGSEVVGFRVRMIIERRYPLRTAFYFLHGLFVLMGIYASARGWLFPAALCLLGALTCFAYTLFLVDRFVISQNALMNVTRAYIKICVKRAASKARRGKGKKQQFYNDTVFLLSRHVVRFLSERCISGELLPMRKPKKDIDFCFLASLLDRICLGESRVPSGKWDRRNVEDNDCLSAFKTCFDDKMKRGFADVNLEYAVIYDLPKLKANTELFDRGISACQELWELLLEPIGDLRQRAATARHLLYITADRCSSFPMLLCGLAAYIRVRIYPAKGGADASAHFLSYLTYGKEYPYLTANELAVGANQRCGAACGDLAFLLICLLKLEEAFSDSGGVYQDRERFFSAAVVIYRRYCSNGPLQSGVYLAYAYRIFNTLNLRAAQSLTFLERSIALPIIRHKIDRAL